ncbi:PAS domain S-box protein [Daejeonella sp.]|uniref:PAS domain S-box protein n=1 Tax=Daejeonella sp. TaxID=2805397 RepID=UPI0030BB6550
MNSKLKILHVEDVSSDAFLVNHQLKKSDLDFEILVVDKREKFIQALNDYSPDIILSDHNLPSFNSIEALAILQKTGLKIPFILITAAMADELAVDLIKKGADDYILKDRLHRLPTAIQNALEKSNKEKERERLSNEHAHLAAIVAASNDGIISKTLDGTITSWNKGAEKILGYSAAEIIGKNIALLIPPDHLPEEAEFMGTIKRGGSVEHFETVRLTKNATRVDVSVTLSPLTDARGKIIGAAKIVYDITEKKKAEEMLRQSEQQYREMALEMQLESARLIEAQERIEISEQQYRRIVETTQEGIWMRDELNRITFVNQRLCEILEYTEDEMIGKEIFHFTNKEGREAFLAAIERRKKGISEIIDLNFVTKSGKKIWAHVSSDPLLDENGIYKGSLSMITDITAKKELQDLLDKSNKRARIGNYELDLIKNTIHWSDITKEIHEVSADYIPDLETAINFYKSGYDREAITNAVQEAIANGIVFDLELVIITANNIERWVRAIGDPEFINGECVKLYGSFQDIDARKKAEIETLKAYEEKNTVLESIGDAFFAVDKDWIVTYWNREAENLMQIPRVKTLGINLWEIFPKAIGSKTYNKYHEAIETNEATNFESFSSKRDKWFEVRAFPSVSGLSVFFTDITERKLADKKLAEISVTLQKHAKDLAMSNEELEGFAFVASHDLQEPLRMVTGFLGQLEQNYSDVLDARGKKYIHFAADGAKRMRQIILDLLEFSRVGKVEDEESDIDLNEIVREIILLCQSQIDETNAIIKFEKLPTLITYKTPLRQVFQNLISNALKYHKKDRTPAITISAEESEAFWQFAVSDNGIGIEEEYFNNIFVIFQRLHNKDEYSGTGIGLAVCKKIILNLGGKIWVESEEDKGSTFYFTIPKK